MRITVDSVEQVAEHWHIALAFAADAGGVTRSLYVLPVDTLEWRAAEYGIDPADTATLLDIVMAEPHLTPEDWAAGSRLHDAPDIATARQHHIARCAAAKLRVRLSTRVKGSPLERVRVESLMDPEVIAVKTEHVAQVREQMAPRQRRAAPDVSRADVLRRQLLGPETVRTMPRPDVVEES